MKLVNVNVDKMQVFVTVNSVAIKINADMNVKKWLTKEYVTKDLFECECDKSCDVGEYLDYENCKCRKRLVDNLIEECTEKGWRSKNNWNNFILA